MQIKIAERLRPFSHLPGVKCVLPNSSLILQFYPEKVIVFDDREKPVAEILFSIEGPMKGFTVQQDLERGEIKVFGRTKNGYLRYRIVSSREKLLALIVEKNPPDFKWSCDQELGTPFFQKVSEQLSLGSHKAQEAEAIRRRLDLAEIFPHWLRLGSMVEPPKKGTGGTLSLLEQGNFQELFLAGFEGIFSPRLTDTEFQGFHLPKVGKDASAFTLLTEGAKLIRSLFLQQKENDLFILPALPSEFHSGRYLNIPLPNIGTLDIEWTKKKIRRLILRSDVSKKITLHFQKGIKRCRLCALKKNMSLPLVLETEEGKTYELDRFEK